MPAWLEIIRGDLIAFSVVALIIAVISIVLAFIYRTVVPTDEVHIIQSSKKTISYGKSTDNGNIYYQWPSWMPVIGIEFKGMPMSVFDIDLTSYEAYDLGRVPFLVDVKAFFRVTDSNQAAERVTSMSELKEQLNAILQGATRSILASSGIEEIMQGRGKYGDEFTKEVDGQLAEWGVKTVKSIELMDIRDAENSEVIKNIMEKKSSLIDMESRKEVAKNRRDAEIAETEAERDSDLKKEQAAEAVGVRSAQKDSQIGIENEKAEQNIKQEAKVTAEFDMAVKKVEEVKQAEINKDVSVVKAEEHKQTEIVKAEGDKQTIVLNAEAALTETTKAAEGIKVTAENEAKGIAAKGEATAEAEKLLQLATVDPQITLAKEIGENKGYQDYLIANRSIEKDQVVGTEQAKALSDADLKVLVNSGDTATGVNKLGDILTSSNGGMAAGAALEAFALTEAGAALLKKFGITLDEAKDLL